MRFLLCVSASQEIYCYVKWCHCGGCCWLPRPYHTDSACNNFEGDCSNTQEHHGHLHQRYLGKSSVWCCGDGVMFFNVVMVCCRVGHSFCMHDRKTVIFSFPIFVQIHGATDHKLVDENSPLNPPKLVSGRPALEKLYLDAGAIVLRPACVFGKSGSLTGAWLSLAGIFLEFMLVL